MKPLLSRHVARQVQCFYKDDGALFCEQVQACICFLLGHWDTGWASVLTHPLEGPFAVSDLHNWMHSPCSWAPLIPCHPGGFRAVVLLV